MGGLLIPKYIADSQEVKLRSFTTSVHSVEAAVAYKDHDAESSGLRSKCFIQASSRASARRRWSRRVCAPVPPPGWFLRP